MVKHCSRHYTYSNEQNKVPALRIYILQQDTEDKLILDNQSYECYKGKKAKRYTDPKAPA